MKKRIHLQRAKEFQINIPIAISRNNRAVQSNKLSNIFNQGMNNLYYKMMNQQKKIS